MGAWIVGMRWFGWLMVLLMLVAMGYAGLRAVVLYAGIAV